MWHSRLSICLATVPSKQPSARTLVYRSFVSASRVTMAPTPIPLPRHICDALGLGPHEVAFREGSATIVLPTKEAAFLNPVQEFNRDLSVLALRAWSETRNGEKRKVFEKSMAKREANNRKRQAKLSEKEAKRRKVATENGAEQHDAESSTSAIQNDVVAHQVEKADQQVEEEEETSRDTARFRDYRFTLLEALSATGLRSIRYAREVPLLRTVLANDLSTTAVAAMKRNAALNFPAGRAIEEWVPPSREKGDDRKALDEDTIANIENGITASATANNAAPTALQPQDGQPEGGQTEAGIQAKRDTANGGTAPSIHPDCKVRINEADAITLMYAHRDDKRKFDVVDLDPYGSASIFLDGAVQCVADGGMLCVTCTDTAVLAGTSHPEKCYSAYGGVTTKVEYSHEVALRLVLHAIASSAGRYGRHIEPLLSLSIDFYVRVFVRVHTKPVEVKKLASKTGAVFTCTGCQLHSSLPFGRHHLNETRGGQVLDKFQAGSGPSVGVLCDECGSRFHTAGPMWLGPLHDPEFCQKMLSIVQAEPNRFATSARIQGMVGTASEELGPEAPFFFTPSRISSFFRCSSPALMTIVSALLFAGHRVSRSHCQPGSLKTTAGRGQVYDLWRAWVGRNPVKMEGISESSPAMRLLKREPRATDWNLDEEHPDARGVIAGSDSSKGTRYQVNPLPNWGPGTAARTTRAK